ncbi:MAG: hypothetical protein WD030_03060 [Pirellulales bacterium]
MSRHSPSDDSKKRIGSYLSRLPIRVKLRRFLGGGTDGDVWESNRGTAIKTLARETGYFNERDTYLRLQDFGVEGKLGKFWVPRLYHYSDELMIVEMDMMQRPPYVIDFAKVRLDRPPDFSDEVMQDMHTQGKELFEHHWPEVLVLLDDLESFQIYYLDPKPGNITFPDLR